MKPILKKMTLTGFAFLLAFILWGCNGLTTTLITTTQATTPPTTTTAEITTTPTVVSTESSTIAPSTTEVPTTEIPTTVLTTVDATTELTTEATFSVTFDSQGGTELDPITGVLSGATISAPIVPTKVGFEFDAWYKEATFTNLWNFSTDTVTEDLTLYANWVELFEVTFDSVGGSTVDPAVHVPDGAMIEAPATPTKTGLTFMGWYQEAIYTTPWDFTSDVVVADITLYAKWAIVVQFDADFGSPAPADIIDIDSGSKLSEPTSMTKNGATFLGWYKEASFDTLWNFTTDTITSNQTLYAKWDIAGQPIATKEEFYAMTISGSSDVFYLLDDLDFTGFEWVESSTGTTFKGTLNGNGKTISNITITGSGTGVYGGIFQRVNGATIIDLSIDNTTVSVEGRAGVLVGRIEGDGGTFDNITIQNSSVSGTAGEGVGVLIGHAAYPTTASHIIILSSSALNSGKNVGFFAGRADNVVNLSDLYVFDSSVTSEIYNTDAGVGGVIGYTNNANANLNLTDVVLQACLLNGRSSGALVGFYKLGAITASNVFLDVDFPYVAGGDFGAEQSGIIGRRTVSDTLDPVLSDVFGHFVGATPGDAIQLDPAAMISDLSLLNQVWWDSNIASFASSDAWNFNEMTHFYTMLDAVILERFSVTFVTHGAEAIDPLTDVIAGSKISDPESTREGYTLLGWYTDELFSVLWNFEVDTVTANLTLYANWEEIVITYTVTFVSGDGSAVDPFVDIVPAALISAPIAPTRDGFAFGGWYKEATYENLWVFETDTVNDNVTLYARWIELFDVTFVTNDGNPIDPMIGVETGSLITPPVAVRTGFTFVGWFKDIDMLIPWIFETDQVTSDVTLYARWMIVVKFQADYGTPAPSDIMDVVSGSTLAEPSTMTKAGANFLGWYKEASFDTLWNFTTDTITSNTTLYAKWDIVGQPIATKEEFYAMTISGSSGVFYLVDNLDFTGFEWVESSTGTTFKGTLNGNGKTIANITITGSGSGVYGGIFQRVNGATIINLTIDNASVSADGRVGILSGRIESAECTVQNVTILNSTASGTVAEGVGILVGNATYGLNASHIVIKSSSASSTGKYVGIVIGRSDRAVSLIDVFIDGSKAETTSTSSDSGAGGLIGYTNAATAALSVTRLVVQNSQVKGGVGGGLIGYYKYGSVQTSDVFVDIEFTYLAGVSGIIGRRNVDAYTTDPVFVSTYAHFVNRNSGSTTVQLDEGNMLADLSGLDQTWWDTHCLAIVGDPKWSYNDLTHFYEM